MLNDYYVLVDNNLKIVIDKIQKIPDYWKNISHPKNFSDEELRDLTWAGHPNIGWVKITSEYIKEYTSTKENLELNKNQLKSIISNIRWEKENSSIQIGSIFITPNEKTRYSLWIKRVQALENPSIKFNYKINQNFYNFTSKEIIDLCDKVEKFVQDCFDFEMKIYEKIDSCETLFDLSKVAINI